MKLKTTITVERRQRLAFTLIELLTVIAIIAVLMGLLFPAVNAVKDAARKTQAKNDLVNIVNAVKAYYTEYGKYPLLSTEQGTDQVFSASATTNDNLFNVLRANGQGRDDPNGTNLNPRRIVFLEVPNVKDTNNPKSGIGSNGQYYDPWGTPYLIAIDGSYDNLIQKASHGYTDSNFSTLNTGVIAWSFGKDKTQGTNNNKTYSGSDDIISWQ